MRRSGSAPAFVGPAVLEAVLLATCGTAAVLAIGTGGHAGCTALVEFGLLSAIGAASAAALLARYAVEVCGIVADYRWFEYWGERIRAAGFVVLGLYALVNGLLDILLPRHDLDLASYPGLAIAAMTSVVTLLVLCSKFRILESLPSRSLFESLHDDRTYLVLTSIVLASLLAHIVTPAWWLDTLLDAAFVALVVKEARGFRRRRHLLD